MTKYYRQYVEKHIKFYLLELGNNLRRNYYSNINLDIIYIVI